LLDAFNELHDEAMKLKKQIIDLKGKQVAREQTTIVRERK